MVVVGGWFGHGGVFLQELKVRESWPVSVVWTVSVVFVVFVVLAVRRCGVGWDRRCFVVADVSTPRQTVGTSSR